MNSAYSIQSKDYHYVVALFDTPLTDGMGVDQSSFQMGFDDYQQAVGAATALTCFTQCSAAMIIRYEDVDDNEEIFETLEIVWVSELKDLEIEQKDNYISRKLS